MSFCHVSLKGERSLPKAYPRKFKTTGYHIRKKRLDLNLCQYEVAQIIGVDKTTVFNWERNYSSSEQNQIPKVIKFLGYLPFEEPETLGEKIAYYRWLKGMTQKELACQLGADPTTLARWERGERVPSGAYRERLISFLDSLTLPPNSVSVKKAMSRAVLLMQLYCCAGVLIPALTVVSKGHFPG